MIHQVKHRWREEMILPVRCINSNIDFLIGSEPKQIKTTDNIVADVIEWKEIHLCKLEKSIKELYGMTVWDFMNKWFNSGEEFDSAHFIYIKSKKNETDK